VVRPIREKIGTSGIAPGKGCSENRRLFTGNMAEPADLKRFAANISRICKGAVSLQIRPLSIFTCIQKTKIFILPEDFRKDMRQAAGCPWGTDRA